MNGSTGPYGFFDIGAQRSQRIGSSVWVAGDSQAYRNRRPIFQDVQYIGRGVGMFGHQLLSPRAAFDQLA